MKPGRGRRIAGTCILIAIVVAGVLLDLASCSLRKLGGLPDPGSPLDISGNGERVLVGSSGQVFLESLDVATARPVPGSTGALRARISADGRKAVLVLPGNRAGELELRVVALDD